MKDDEIPKQWIVAKSIDVKRIRKKVWQNWDNEISNSCDSLKTVKEIEIHFSVIQELWNQFISFHLDSFLSPSGITDFNEILLLTTWVFTLYMDEVFPQLRC